MIYSLKQGLRNICGNFRLSLASVATISACIFIFCIFYCINTNLNMMIENIETKVGITVFFDENLNEEDIQSIGNEIAERNEVREMKFVSAEEAWEAFKTDYFKGKEELAEGFAEDNPLKGSSSYTIFLNSIDRQDGFVDYLHSIKGIRQVNYSTRAANSLESLGRLIRIVSLTIIGILLLVSAFLIGNTISVSVEFKKGEVAIMRLVGATSKMIKAPFVIEGVILGLLGTAIPLTAVWYLYDIVIDYLNTQFSIMSDILTFASKTGLFPNMTVVSAILGIGMGFFVSLVTIEKHMRV